MNENESERRQFERRWTDVDRRIGEACARSGRDRGAVEVIARTETFGPEYVEWALEAGLSRMGEVRVPETAWKAEVCSGHPEWHFLGTPSPSKILPALNLFGVFHTVGSEAVADRLGEAAEGQGVRPEVLVEVNTSGGGSRRGVDPASAPRLVESVLRQGGLRLIGLTTVPPVVRDPERTRPAFARLRELADRLRRDAAIDLPVLCMGSSRDFDVAVEEGATWLCLGGALFGPRQSWSRLQRRIRDNGI